MEFNKKNFIERKIVVQTLKKWFCMEYKNLITTAVKINILSIWPPEKIVCFFRTPIKKLIVFYANFSREYWKFLKQSDFLSFKLIYRYYIWVNIKGGFLSIYERRRSSVLNSPSQSRLKLEANQLWYSRFNSK